MALSKMSEIRELTDEELQEQIVAVKRELFDLRFQKATRQLEKPHQFKHIRHRLSQLLTAERERQIEQLKASSSDSQAVQEASTENAVEEPAVSKAEEE